MELSGREIGCEFSSEEIDSIVQAYGNHKAPGESLLFLSQSYAPASAEPIGFLGAHYIMTLKLQRGKIHEEVNLFLKFLPLDLPKKADYLSEMSVFNKEVNMYKNILPEISKMIKTSQSPISPKCYFAKENVLVMENAKNLDYKMLSNETLTFDYEHLEVALKKIAVMQAASLVLEKKTEKSLLEIFPSMLDENAYPDDTTNVRILGHSNAIDVMIALIQLIPKYENSPDLKFILNTLPGLMRKIFQFAEVSKKYVNVFLHADLWSNNLMFLYDEKDQPVDCILVDFQLSRYAPPALDVISLLQLTTFKEMLQKSQDKLLEVYYTSFIKELNANGLDSLQIFPKDKFLDSCKHYKLAGLVESALFTHMTLLPPDYCKSMVYSSEEFDTFIRKSRVPFCARAFKENDHYRLRMTDILCEMVDDFILALK